MRGFQPDLPDVTFDEGLTIHDELQEVHLVFRGRAHTASDLCVWSPQEHVLATGDLVVGFLPGMGDGYPLEWPATLRSARELDFTRVLPGHGAVQEGRTQLDAMRSYIEELNERVLRAKQAGRSLQQVQGELRPDTVRALTGDYGKYVAAMTSRFRPLPPGADPWPVIAGALKGNIEAIYSKA